MATKPIRFHPEADREYLSSLEWYSERSPSAALVSRQNSSAQCQPSKNFPSDGLPISLTATDTFFEDFRLALFTTFATLRWSFLQ